MKDAWLDTEIEIPLDEATARSGVGDDLAKEIINTLRDHAQRVLLRDAGASAYVRTDRMPETVSARKTSPILGGDLLLVRMRWPVVVPDSHVT